MSPLLSMKQIQLGGHKKGSRIRGYAIVDDEDYEVLNAFKWYAMKHGNTFYAVRAISNGKGRQKTISVHREILKPKKGLLCDHVNHNGLDNRRENLRVCTHQENMYNMQISRKNNTSGYKGVVFYKPYKKWCAQIRFQNKGKTLGYFSNPRDAARAYNEAALKYHGTFANLNTS